MSSIERLAPSEGKSGCHLAAENSALIHATSDIYAIHAAEISLNPSIAAMSAIIKQGELPEDNIIFARDSQSDRRAC
jgi:hypothetical protein